MTASHPEHAKMEAGVALGRRQERKTSFFHLSPIPGLSAHQLPPVSPVVALTEQHTLATKGNPMFSITKMTTSFIFQVAFPRFQLHHLAEVLVRKTG